MSRRSRLLLLLLIITIFTSEFSIAAQGEKKILHIQLQPVHKANPGFNLSHKPKQAIPYLIRMVKIRDNPQFKSLPTTDASVLYYGAVKLGTPVRTHGVLIDLESNEKLLWVDSDADNNFAGEIGYPVFKSDRVPGTNYYYSPTPISFQVAFDFEDRRFENTIQFDLAFLAVARTGYRDYFTLTTRTWFTGNLHLEDLDLRIGIIDTNNNGIFGDSEDLLLIDEDYDLNFTPKESRTMAETKTIKLFSKRWNVSYKYLPEQLILTER